MRYEVATFSGGCFWCMEPAFEAEDGVFEAITGYAGGTEKDAKYKFVARGETDHRESVQVKYDPDKISYEKLLDIYWRQIDPTDKDGQFTDRGPQYTTAIYYHNDLQKASAQKSKQDLEESGRFGKPIVTEILPFSTFFPAEEYHQDYYKKASEHYKRYKKGSGRADFIEKNWARDAALEAADNDYKEEKLQALDPTSYHVIVEGGTERPFDNEYWDNKEEGIYVDKVTGKALFSSTHKFDSGTGWPSFWRPIEEGSVETCSVAPFPMKIEEVRSEGGHVGHVFNDGPRDKGGQRYCTNSASLTFIPKADMEAKGYGEYLYLFDASTDVGDVNSSATQ